MPKPHVKPNREVEIKLRISDLAALLRKLSELCPRQCVRISPAAHTHENDVEIVFRLEQDEFFDLETFSSRGNFLAKTQTFRLYFNLVRRNSHKENQSLWQIIERLAPGSPLELCLLPPVFLDY